jgi:hypothetical protein
MLLSNPFWVAYTGKFEEKIGDIVVMVCIRRASFFLVLISSLCGDVGFLAL